MIADSSNGGLLEAGFFLLRSPLVPIDAVMLPGGLDAGVRAVVGIIRGGSGGLPASHANHLRLELWYPVVTALVIAAPDLVAAVATASTEEARVKADRALAKYVLRAATRCTPFGMFAGCTAGQFVDGDQIDFRMARMAANTLHVSLDSAVHARLFELEQASDRNAGQFGDTRFYANPSLAESDGRYYYAKRLIQHSGARIVGGVATVTPELASTIARASDGASAGELQASLVEGGATPADAEAYIRSIVGEQLLLPSTLGASLTQGYSPAPAVRHNATRQSVDSIVTTLAHQLRHPCGSGLRSLWLRVRTSRSAIVDAAPELADTKDVFHVSMVKPQPTLSLPKAIVRELGTLVDVLTTIGGHRVDPLAEFAADFVARFERRPVRLIEALDPEVGVQLPMSPPPEGPSSVEVSAPSWEHLLALAQRAWRMGAPEIALTPDDVSALGRGHSRGVFPPAFAIMGTLIAPSAADVATGQYSFVVDNVGLQPALAFIGRFGRGYPALERSMLAFARAEEADAAPRILADIDHLPGGRIDNIVVRPASYRWSIPLYTRPATPPQYRISLADLVLTHDGHHLRLWDTTRRVEVLPRLTNAHNYFAPGNHPVYRLLGALQKHQEARPMAWQWGPLGLSPTLPRVRYGRFILARRRWNISARSLKPSRQVPGHSDGQHLRDALGLPRHVVLQEGDNRLPLDLEDEMQAGMLIDAIRQRGRVTATEMLPELDDHCLEGPDGRFAHELVIPVRVTSRDSRAKADPSVASHDRPPLLAPDTTRYAVPGSPWAYYKIYGGPRMADRLMFGPLGELVQRATRDGTIDRLFYLRFADPDFHLRLRFRATDPADGAFRLKDAIAKLLAREVRERRVRHVELATYERELERYGGDSATDIAERMFTSSTLAVLTLLSPNPTSPAGDWARHLAVLAGATAFFRAFGLTMVECRDFCRDAARPDRAERQLWSRHFRATRTLVEALLREEEPIDAAAVGAHRAAMRMSEQLRPLAHTLRHLEATAALTVPVQNLLTSQIHMHINRAASNAGLRVPDAFYYFIMERGFNSLVARSADGACSLPAR